MRNIAHFNYKVMNWKNGGGKTQEIALSPADGQDIDWRISMATISQSGGFSIFPNIDRSIALLEGERVLLDIKDIGRILLDKSSQPYAFKGEYVVAAEVSQQTLDLNVMTNRLRYHHVMERLDISSSIKVKKEAEHFFIFFNDACDLLIDGKSLAIPRFNTIELDNGEEILINHSGKNFSLFIIKIWPVR